ncbi:hypothetical protein KM043_001114 [Ampulex compressa]|nr:hypothetical protein KM043_001114 [Ampulex compressa]
MRIASGPMLKNSNGCNDPVQFDICQHFIVLYSVSIEYYVLTEDNQKKYRSRSSARHLRRKLLKNAHRAKQEPDFMNDPENNKAEATTFITEEQTTEVHSEVADKPVTMEKLNPLLQFQAQLFNRNCSGQKICDCILRQILQMGKGDTGTRTKDNFFPFGYSTVKLYYEDGTPYCTKCVKVYNEVPRLELVLNCSAKNKGNETEESPKLDRLTDVTEDRAELNKALIELYLPDRGFNRNNLETLQNKTKTKIVKSVSIKQEVTFAPTSKCYVRELNVIKRAKADLKSLVTQHLYDERQLALVHVASVNSSIHPAIVRLGVQYADKVIVGSNARCVALLAAVKRLIEDFQRPQHADFIRGLEARLQESVAYLHHCRPLAVSMQNALRHLKWQMTQLPPTLSDKDAKGKLECAVDTYIAEQIELADKAISLTIQTKISNGNVILTYGYSSLIHKILLDAHTAGKKFRVVVVDGRPWLEGREQLRRLAKHGIECSYILINALSFIMPEVSKVFLGAHAILANGAVMSRVGTAQIALMARAFNVPVLVACETHKSCERVQTDSIVYNELGKADELAQTHSQAKKSLLTNWRSKKYLNLLNITYDVTPADLVSAVVTELAILPCTSVPVILRIKPSEI